MTRRSFVTLPALLLALLALAVPATAKTTTTTDKTLHADLVRLADGAGGSGGFVVSDGKTGKTIAQSRPTTVRPLGSTAKLLTTGAALRALGPGFRLTTTVLTMAGVDAAGTLHGDLWLKGGGDPTLGEAQFQTLAAAVQARGIKVVEGSIVGDESLFDTLRGGPATNGAFDLNFAGSVGALTYERGRQAVDGPLQPDPARAAAFRFDDVLEAKGLTIRGTPKAGVAPVGTAQLGLIATTVAAVVKVIDKQSDDFAAEVLAKDLGAAHGGAGTTAAGVGVIKANIFGAQLFPVDGSGVDPATTGAPRQLARLVRRLRTQPGLGSALPIAGVDGTLQARMTSGPARGTCRAKTGSLPTTRFSALAGWCKTHGRTLVFALQRDRVTSQAAAKAAEDAMVQRIAASRKR
ncbi:D-alanyl-D-alanine carboxypeptidase/D-alanyl-D-alanine-endopeptidase [Baekduia alba]|uniref:D-alanyl-D-alanine carboxypeptidase/D-alanyl-D-alanine-endopeptidase n=1 Tax=Baekduia alba TaxID=2997333 RepID=UPI0023422718|nr:D-alanyl-D-alanine carboxypeptidase [Baekduia alba]